MAESTTKSKRVLPIPAQVRGARGLLHMSQGELAEAAGIGRATVDRYERGQGEIKVDVLEKIADALERRGIRFTNGTTPTVTLDTSKAVIPL